MKNNTQYTNQPDEFSRQIRQKLENYEPPINATWWGEIEAAISVPKKKKIIPFWLWISGGAAVATLALLLSLPFNSNRQSSIGKRTHKTELNIKDSALAIETKKQSGRNNASVNMIEEKLHVKKQAPVQNKKNTETTKVVNESTINDSATSTIPRIEKRTHENELLTQQKSVKNDSITNGNTKRYIPETLAEKTDIIPDIKPKHKKDLLLAAAFSSGSSASFSGTSEMLNDTGDKGLTSAVPAYTSVMTPNDFTSKNFIPPFSFGLTLRKPFNDNIGLESGFIYTRLTSTFEKSGMISYDAKLNLHYLGIPLNLYVNVWKNPKWQVYISGGGMVEKGLRSVYTQNEYIGNQTYSTVAKTNIDGLQWSLNGGLGINYTLVRNVGIYFEPKLSYFFDNAQPVSIRTNSPVAAGLLVGLRFHL